MEAPPRLADVVQQVDLGPRIWGQEMGSEGCLSLVGRGTVSVHPIAIESTSFLIIFRGRKTILPPKFWSPEIDVLHGHACSTCDAAALVDQCGLRGIVLAECQAPFPPVAAHSLLLNALTAAIE